MKTNRKRHARRHGLLMSDSVEFFVPGPPVAKGRPRMTRAGHIYTPKKTHDAEALFRLYARTNLNRATGPLSMRVRFGMPIPKSYSKKKRQAIQAGEFHHDKKPDLDNLLKLVLDALNGVAYEDDKQVIDISACKFYAESVGTTVQLKQWEMAGE